MRKYFLFVILATTLLAACSPQFNWRDYSSEDAPFRVMLGFEVQWALLHKSSPAASESRLG